MDYEGNYRTLYEDQLEGATEDYHREFEANNSPDSIDWTYEAGAKDSLCSLLSELYEDRTDFEELVTNAGLTQAAMQDVGFFS